MQIYSPARRQTFLAWALWAAACNASPRAGTPASTTDVGSPPPIGEPPAAQVANSPAPSTPSSFEARAERIVEEATRGSERAGMYSVEQPVRAIVTLLPSGDVYLRVAPAGGGQEVQRGKWEERDGKVSARMTLDRAYKDLPAPVDYVFAVEDDALRVEKWDRALLGEAPLTFRKSL